MYRLETAALSIAFGLFQSPFARAQDSGSCNAALVQSTYNQNGSQFHDWRLAEHVSEEAYNEVKHAAGARAEIFGVPIGADYSDFRSNIQSFSGGSEQALTSSQAENVMWTGLSRDSLTAYSDCLSALSNQSGLSLVVDWATETDVALTLRWHPRMVASSTPEPATIDVEWSGSVGGTELPASVSEGDGVPIIVPRPVKESTLAVRSGGIGSSVILTPLPTALPPTKPREQSFDCWSQLNSSGQFYHMAMMHAQAVGTHCTVVTSVGGVFTGTTISHEPYSGPNLGVAVPP
jgi:hypothetical protein